MCGPDAIHPNACRYRSASNHDEEQDRGKDVTRPPTRLLVPVSLLTQPACTPLQFMAKQLGLPAGSCQALSTQAQPQHPHPAAINPQPFKLPYLCVSFGYHSHGGDGRKPRALASEESRQVVTGRFWHLRSLCRSDLRRAYGQMLEAKAAVCRPPSPLPLTLLGGGQWWSG